MTRLFYSVGFPLSLISLFPISAIPFSAKMADGATFCSPHQRDFITETSLLQYPQISERHIYYCLRCDEKFASASEIEQHSRNSGNHYICDPCETDFPSRDDLYQHETDEHKCTTCLLYFGTPRKLEDVCSLTWPEPTYARD